MAATEKRTKEHNGEFPTPEEIMLQAKVKPYR